MTGQRRAICAALVRFHDQHLTVSALREKAQAEAQSAIDLSTVYRTIDALEQEGLIRHVHLGHGPSILHLSDPPDHHHLVCEVCGKTEDIPLSELEAMIAAVEEAHGFVADSVHFALVGRCAAHGEKH